MNRGEFRGSGMDKITNKPHDGKIVVDWYNEGNYKNIEDYILNDRINGHKKFNIEATPTLIINDKKFDNPHNYKKLKKNIEKLI